MNVVSNATNYFNEVRAEMAKVTWPTRSQTIRMTILVIIVSVVMGIFIGGLDFVFSRTLTAILQR